MLCVPLEKTTALIEGSSARADRAGPISGKVDREL